MTAYEYLNQVSYINRRIQYDLMELEELRLRSMSVSSPNLEESFSHGGSTEAPFVKVLELLWKRQEQVNRELAELDAKREEIKGVIEQLENKDERMLLLYRYVQGMKWEDIGEQLHAGRTTLHRWHKQALSKIKVPESQKTEHNGT